MKLPDSTPRSDICEGGWTGFQSLDMEEDDPTTFHRSKVRDREPDPATIPGSKRLKMSDHSGEGFRTYGGSSEPSGEDVEMTDSAENVIGGLHYNEVSNFHHQIWQEFQGWREMLSGLQLTKDERMLVQGKLESFEHETQQLYQSWQPFVWETETDRFPDPKHALLGEDSKKVIKDATEKWLKSVLKIEEMDKFLPEWRLQNTQIRHHITQGYELIFKFMINFKDMRLISEEDLFNFLNKETDGQIITAYAAWSYFDPITEPYWHQNIKEKLLGNKSVYGLPAISNLLNQDTWKKIEIHYLYRPLNSLLEDKSLDGNYFYHILKQFLSTVEDNNNTVSIDHMYVFMEHLSFSRKIHTQQNKAELLAEYLKRNGISTTSMIQQVFAGRESMEPLIRQLMWQWNEENRDFFSVLGCIRRTLHYYKLLTAAQK